MNDYRIPWAPPDATPGVQLLLGSIQQQRAGRRAEENTKVQRMYADAAMRRISAQEARDKAEHDRKIAKDQADALEHAADLMGTDPGVGQAYGAIMGVPIVPKPSGTPASPGTNPLFRAATPVPSHNTEPSPPPAPTLDSEPMPALPMTDTPMSDAELSGLAEGPFYGPPEAPKPSDMPGGELTVDQLAAAAAPEAGSLERSPQAPAAGSVMPGEQAEGMISAPTPLLYQAVVAGKNYDLTPQTPTTGLGQKYDERLAFLLRDPSTRKTARARVLLDYEKDQAATAANQRATDAQTARKELADAHHLTVSQLLEQRGLDRASREKIAGILARAKMTASGMTVSPQDAANLKTIMEHFGETGDLPAAAGEAAAATNAKGKPAPLSPKVWEPALKQMTTQAAAGERSGQNREQLVASGPGIPEGSVWNNKNAATKGTQIVQRFHRVEERLKELIADVEQNGERIDFDTKQYVNRLSKAKAAAAALRPYNELSSTDASMRSEEAILGPTGAFGHGWMLGADLTTLKRLLAEAQGQQQVNLQTLLRPGGGSKLSPVLGGQPGAPKEKTEAEKDAEFMRKLGL